jgi:hypothetical protein
LEKWGANLELPLPLPSQSPLSPTSTKGMPEKSTLTDGDQKKSPLIKGDLGGFASPHTVAYLHEHPFLMVDTALFDVTFKGKLLGAIDNLDESLDGLLIHGDNFQALNLLQELYREQVKCVYIDPPYNTDSEPIAYKNGFRDSSYMSLMADRLSEGKELLSNDGIICTTIDDYEHKNIGICGYSEAPVQLRFSAAFETGQYERVQRRIVTKGR